MGEECRALKILCHRRHSLHGELHVCLQELFGSRPPATALHLTGDLTPASYEDALAGNLQGDLFILLPANAQGGAAARHRHATNTHSTF